MINYSKEAAFILAGQLLRSLHQIAWSLSCKSPTEFIYSGNFLMDFLAARFLTLFSLSSWLSSTGLGQGWSSKSLPVHVPEARGLQWIIEQYVRRRDRKILYCIPYPVTVEGHQSNSLFRDSVDFANLLARIGLHSTNLVSRFRSFLLGRESASELHARRGRWACSSGESCFAIHKLRRWKRDTAFFFQK